jgi:K+-sensing histidine kinase KdpD
MMIERTLTIDRMPQRRPAGGAHPDPTRGVENGHVTPAPTLQLVADGVAAFAAAPDLYALSLALARRLARAASADYTTVWLCGTTAGGDLALAAGWPEGGVASRSSLALADAPCAAEAFDRRAALRTHLRNGQAALVLDGRRDAAVWVVPLLAGRHRMGLAYVVGCRTASHEDEAQVLTILGAQAALAARALVEPLAVRREAAEFLAVVAHDLKNVATSIKGYTQLLRRHLPAESAPRADRWTGIVEQQVGVLAGTLSALVDLGRLHCGRVALERQPADLRQVVETIADRLPATDDAPPLRLELPADAVPGTWDTVRLERALIAALDTVRRAAPAEGEALAVVVAVADGAAHLSVGTPPPAESWPTAGEWSPSAEATLYLLRGIVEAHNGTISYRRTADGQPLLQIVLPLEPSRP